LQLTRKLRANPKPQVRRAVRWVARKAGTRPRRGLAEALLRLPAGSSGGRAGAWLSNVHVRALAASGHGEEARAFAVERGGSPGTRPRLAMAEFLADSGRPREARAILGGDPDAAGPAERRAWHLLHARVARTLGRYTEALEALDDLLIEAPGDRAALAEGRRVEQVVERYTEVPHVTLPAPDWPPIPGRILHLVEMSLDNSQSGYTIRTHQVALAQRLAGLDPHVLVVGAAPRKGILARSIDDVPYRWLEGAVGMRRAAKVSWSELADQAAKVVRELRPAVLHAATPPTVGNLGRGLSRWSGLPLVYEVRGFRDEFWRISREEDEEVDHARLSREADTASMRGAHAVVTLGEQMKSEVAQRGVERDRVAIVPNAVDTSAFRPGARDHSLAASYGIGRDEVVVGYISSFQPYEDFATLVEALGLLRSRGRSVRGLLVGDGSTRPEVVRQVAELGLESVIVMPGQIPHAEVPRHHRLIDVFVVPRVASRLSQLVAPLKPLEAMASGRALVVSRLDALRETVDDGRTGMTFLPGSAVDLASVLDRLVLDPVERKRLGDAARTWVEAERTLERNGQRYRDVYARIGVPLS
jgi:glycosyltransferase involved in cell wall biosynthesis